MNPARMLSFLVVAFVLLSTATFSMTYFYINVEGSPSTTQIQGEEQVIMADCGPAGFIQIYYYLDLDSSGTIGTGEPAVFALSLEDNSTDFPPDLNPADGVMEIVWPLHMQPGHYVVLGMDGADAVAFPYHVLAPDPILMSIAGRLTFEGITPPDSRIANYPFLIGTMEPPMLMYTMTDQWGDYSVNWPGAAATVFALFVADFPGWVAPDLPIRYVDGHVTDFDIFIPRADEGMTYFYMMVDGVESTIQTQGQEQFIMADCDSTGTIELTYYMDLNENSVLDTGEPMIFQMNMMDNSTEFPPDMDPADGVLQMFWPLNMQPGYYIIAGRNGSMEIQFPYRVLAPEPLLRSVSGRLIFEGITPPDSRLEYIPFLIGTMSPPMLMYALTDEWGDYTVNWPGGDATVSALFMGDIHGYELHEDPVYFVDGHVTDFDIEFFISGGLSNLRLLIDGVESSSYTQGQRHSFRWSCMEWGGTWVEIYIDEDSDGYVDPEDMLFFGTSWYVPDNSWIPEWYNDINGELGQAEISPSFFLPPGSYIFRAYDGSATAELPFAVNPPSPLDMSVSGVVTLETHSVPSTVLDGLVVYVTNTSRTQTYYTYVDAMGNYTCNWASGMTDIIIGFEQPYPSPDWDFSATTRSAYIDGILLGMDLFVPLLSFPGWIHVNFEVDAGLWDIRPSEVTAEYFDPITGAVIDNVTFPDSGDIYLPVRPYACGIVMKATDPVYFTQHNFISPCETLWISPDSYPLEYDVFASQCCYHFKLKLDGFELDSVPDDGIPYDLYGTGPDGQSYYSEAKMFIQLSGDEYVVMGGREMCPANWRAVLRDPLPGGFIPDVFETTFVIPRVETWPHMLISIPVRLENISEAELPEDFTINLYPNPFNGAVSIDFRIEQPGIVSVEVFNIMGGRVASLDSRSVEKGAYRAVWNCTDGFGNPVSTGVYLFKVSTPKETRVLRGMYLK